MEERPTADRRRRRVVRIEADVRDAARQVREAALEAREAAREARTQGRRLGRALADPVRLQIFELLAEDERTVKDLASSVGMAPDRLYYHLNLLQEAGIIQIAELRPERVYALRDEQQTTSREDVAELIGTVLDATTSELRQVLHFAAEARARGDERKLHAAIARSSVELTADEFRDFMERVTELVDSVAERSEVRDKRAAPSKGRADRRPFRIVLAGYETLPGEESAS